MHANLYAHGDSDEVYQALQRDFARDSRAAHFWEFVAFLALLWLVREWGTTDKVAAFAFWIAFAIRERTFIDNSNRNWFMHLLDFRHAQETRESVGQ